MASTIALSKSPAMTVPTDLFDENSTASCSDATITERRSERRSKLSGMDSSRHAFQTNYAFIMSSVTMLLMGVLSLLFSEFDSSSLSSSSSSSTVHSQRWLEEDNIKDDSDTMDYSNYSCGYIYDQTPDPGDARCQFARTCNQGNGIWAPFVFCHTSTFSTTFLVSCISPLIFLWLVLLFRMLGSTAEDYFSPALEMFSVKLGLPPRFAGVTLLALGNGAADVSATVSSITSDQENGYKLALGALTGAAMVIGCVVSALVVLVAGGVPCRGALVRDVLALLVAVLVVWNQLAVGSIGPEAVSLFLSLYAMFVMLVLAADIYHRAVVLPRLAAAAQERELERQLEEQERMHGVGVVPSLTPDNDDHDLLRPHTTQQPQPQSQPQQSQRPPNQQQTGATAKKRIPDGLLSMLTAFSNYDQNDVSTEGWGVESDDLAQDRPIVLHGTHGIMHGDGHLNSPVTDAHYSMLQDDACATPGALGIPATNWAGAFHDGRNEIIQHASSVWEDIVWNGDVNVVSKFLLLCELPFTTLRKLTVPIPCEGFYVRAMVALSVAISPVWLIYYLWNMHGINLLDDGGWFYFLVLWLLFVFGSVLIQRYAPGGEGDMSLHLATPIALYGFAIAATWIDTIADNLVNLLDFVGIILKIPAPIVGLTILAWGNSMGDLSANMTMARKGLANMAMTACFAGPLFNILVGLGLGFSSLAARTGKVEAAVSLSPSVVTGFLFIIVNTGTVIFTGLLLGQGNIPVKYGYIALTLYTIYLVTSIALQYSKYGDN